MQALTLDIDGPIHVVDHGGRGTPLVLVHGLGGSHLNWAAVASDLTQQFHVLAIDLVGFGLSPPEGRSASVEANQRLLGRFLEEHVGRPAILAGSSMGGLISLLQAAAEPQRVAGLVLVNPALPRNWLERIDPRVLRLFGVSALPYAAEWVFEQHDRRTSPEQTTRDFLALCCVDPDVIPAEVLEAHLAYAREKHLRPWADRAFIEAARSLLRLLLLRRGEVDRAVKAVQAPTLLIGGAHDKLVPMTAVERVARLRPDWTLESFGHVGHVPMLEDPHGFVERVLKWAERNLEAAGSSAA